MEYLKFRIFKNRFCVYLFNGLLDWSQVFKRAGLSFRHQKEHEFSNQGFESNI